MADEPRVMHGDDTMSPVDLPGAPEGKRPLVWTSIVIAVAAVFLLLTNAVTIHGWAVELPPSVTTARIISITEQWEATTDHLGLGAPRALVHGWWTGAQNARFGAERPAD